MAEAHKPSQTLTIAKPNRGRPSKFTEELAQEICERHKDGESLNAICRDKAPLSPSTVRDWAIRSATGELKEEEVCGRFSTRFAHARDLYYHALAAEVVDVADDNSQDMLPEGGINHANVQRSKLRCDARKWIVAKALPNHYGERVEHHVEHKQVDADPQDIARALLDMGLDAKLINQEPE